MIFYFFYKYDLEQEQIAVYIPSVPYEISLLIKYDKESAYIYIYSTSILSAHTRYKEFTRWYDKK